MVNCCISSKIIIYYIRNVSIFMFYCRTGAERSCLYCAVSVLIEKMEIEHEVSVVNTLRQIKARRLSAISSVVSQAQTYARIKTYSCMFMLNQRNTAVRLNIPPFTSFPLAERQTCGE